MPTVSHGRPPRPQQHHPRAHTYLTVSGVFCVILPIVLSRMAMVCCESIHHLNHLNHRQQHQPAPQQWSPPQSAHLIKATSPVSSSSSFSISNHQTDALFVSPGANGSNKTNAETELDLKYPRNIKEIITSIAYDKGSFQPTTTGTPLFNHQVQSSGEPAVSRQVNESRRMLDASSFGGITPTATQQQQQQHLMAQEAFNRSGSQLQWQPTLTSSLSFSQKTSPHQLLTPATSARLESRIVANFRELSSANNNNNNISDILSAKSLSKTLDSSKLAAGSVLGGNIGSRKSVDTDNELRKDNRIGDYVNLDYENGFDANEAAELATSNSPTESQHSPSTASTTGSSASLPVGSSTTTSSPLASGAGDENDLDVEAGGSVLADNEGEQDDDISDSGEQQLTTGVGSSNSAGSSSGVSKVAPPAAGTEGRGGAKTATQGIKTKKLRTARQRYSQASNISTGSPTPSTSATLMVTASEWFSRGDTKAAGGRPTMGDRHLIRARHLTSPSPPPSSSRFSTLIRDGNANQSGASSKAKLPANNDAEDHPFDNNNVGYLLAEENSGMKTKKKVLADAEAGVSRASHRELAMKIRQTNSRALERASSAQELGDSIKNLLRHPAVSSSLPLLLSKMDAVASLNKGHLNQQRPPTAGINGAAGQPTNQVREYKTNYSSLFDTLSPQYSRSAASGRPQIRHRDLRANPFLNPNDKQQQQTGVPIKDSFVPYYGSSSNHSLLNFHAPPFIGGSVAQKLAPPDGIIIRPSSLPVTGNPLQYISSMPMLPTLLAQDQQDFGYNPLRNSIHQRHLYNGHNDFQVSSPQLLQHEQPNKSHHHQVDQMLANSNQLGVAHLNPAAGSLLNPHFGDSSSYTSFIDYPDRSYDSLASPQASVSSHYQKQSSLQMPAGLSIDSGSYVNHQPQASTMSAIMSDDYRSHQDYQSDLNSSYEPPTSASRGSSEQTSNSSPTSPTRPSNSRSSQSDVFYRHDGPTKPRDLSSGGGGSGSGYPSRSSISSDPYEDVGNGISPVELEKDLTDLDEEFTRANFRRPSSSSSVDPYMAERYESRRYNNRRPVSYETYSNDYSSGAGSSVVTSPRSYYRPYAPAWAASSYYDAGDLWGPDALADYSPLSSYLNPNHYATHYRWRPTGARYQRTYAATTNPYLSAAASEPQHIHPAATYSLIPAATGAYSTAGAPLQPATETISFTLSPLAAAAAAAASALAAADKSRHHNHWLTAMPTRITTTALGPTLAGTATSAIPGYPSAAAFYPRAAATTNPYAAAAALAAAASMPMYALGPRSAPANPLAAAATTGATAYSLPYPYGAGPLVAYRPTSAASLLAAAAAAQAPLLSAASFAYPTAMRLPVRGFVPAFNPKLVRPYHGADLQFAETKPKPNVTNNNNSDNNDSKGGSKSALKAAGTLTAMAKNLTRKMFGSSSQPRPSHVAPPGHSSSSASTSTTSGSTSSGAAVGGGSHHSASAALYDFFAAPAAGVIRR